MKCLIMCQAVSQSENEAGFIKYQFGNICWGRILESTGGGAAASFHVEMEKKTESLYYQ
jgi:hypothetical protein